MELVRSVIVQAEYKKTKNTKTRVMKQTVSSNLRTSSALVIPNFVFRYQCIA